MDKFVHHLAILILEYLIADSQIYNIVHYSPAFLSLKDLADTREVSRNNAKDTATLILLICAKPKTSQINSLEVLS